MPRAGGAGFGPEHLFHHLEFDSNLYSIQAGNMPTRDRNGDFEVVQIESDETIHGLIIHPNPEAVESLPGVDAPRPRVDLRTIRNIICF